MNGKKYSSGYHLRLYLALWRSWKERKNWTAGLRTHDGVCGCLFNHDCFCIWLCRYGRYSKCNTRPSRIAAQVVSGIGFIGAGTIFIFKTRNCTRAYNCRLWTVAAIGLATGSGMYFQQVLQQLLRYYFMGTVAIGALFSKNIITVVKDSNAINNYEFNNIETRIKIQSFTLDKNEHEHIYQVKLENSDSSD